MTVGFVIHGNNATTLEAALRSLRQVCDFVVCIDSGSTDGSYELARASADVTQRVPWKGFGAARSAAVDALCSKFGPDEWCVFLDSDEAFAGDVSRASLDAALATAPVAQGYRFSRRNWVTRYGTRWLLSTDHRVRLFRLGVAPWAPAQIVHEAFPQGPWPRLGVTIDHAFVNGPLDERRRKQHLYALLWAVQNADGTRRAAPPALAFAWQAFRELTFRGGLLRGGLAAFPVASALAEYSELKHRELARCRAGAHDDLLAAYREGRFDDLFRRAAQTLADAA